MGDIGAFVSIGDKTADFLNDGETIEADGWYRGETTNFYPRNREPGSDRDIDNIYQHVLKGWEPAEPFIGKDDLITAFGSCFAAYIESNLRWRGYKTSIGQYGNPDNSNYWGRSLIIKCGEGFVNTFSLRTQLEWIFEGATPDVRIWHKSEGVLREYIDSNRDAAERIFNETEVFIFTLGLSEVWFNKKTCAVLWAGVPKRHFDPDIYGFRVVSAAENFSNLARIVDLIRAHRGDVPIIFTVSPVPHNATFRPVSCITASFASKARIRVAVDDLMLARPGDERLFYFPSYEMVQGYFERPWRDDNVHVSDDAISTIMSVFERYYCRASDVQRNAQS